MKMNGDIKNENIWYYYLYDNGDLVSKSPASVDRMNTHLFVDPKMKKVWKLNLKDRATLWKCALEAVAKGAKLKRIYQLAIRWGLTIEDSLEMIRHLQPNMEQTAGLNIFIVKIFHMELEDYWKMITIKAEEV